MTREPTPMTLRSPTLRVLLPCEKLEETLAWAQAKGVQLVFPSPFGATHVVPAVAE